MTQEDKDINVLPYSLIVGQDELRQALEISYVDPSIGVLAAGQRGTAKSTTIRSFALMAYDELPVTLPLGATDDRILGGLNVEALLRGQHEWLPGLLHQASDSAARMLYVDEVNLLDDHLVNLILDAASTGVLVVQRDNVDRGPTPVRFALVGTMNPEEGGLRPQLLDRFGLVVTMDADVDADQRRQILETVLRYDDARERAGSAFLRQARERNRATRHELEAARGRLREVRVGPAAIAACARLASDFATVGHRGEMTLVRAARALAARWGHGDVGPEHVAAVARSALNHRRPNAESGTLLSWTADEDGRVKKALSESTGG